ncbi:hypothetical protein N9922_00625 [Cyclobacteriaceae bacterium]|jgi:hypothetical protein|nr:hypothetical protein [Cyclobacteriaceae bacterium]MDB4315065.1 hypothetical protein [Cyclobacteriaceae bacterium]MDB4741807.1 hypothetical protein [Cyclobacteriaceae bacterium]|tara:strand:+ start:1021 stop:1197 length:177 start_codon:yes stop_codon:yes gene_type:complete
MKNPFEVIEARLNNIETLLIDIKHQLLTEVEIPLDELTNKEVKNTKGCLSKATYNHKI